MPIPRSVVRHAAGTDTRNQFTTPPDARQVEDLMVAHENAIVGAHQKRTAGYSTQFTHNSGSGTWDTVNVTSGAHFWTDGYMNTSADCYGPVPDDWFDDWTYLCFDVPWTIDWADSTGYYFLGVQVRTRLYASPYTIGSTTPCWTDLYDGATDAYDQQGSASGTCSVRIAQGQVIDIQMYQSGRGSSLSVDFQWGVRLICGTD